MEGPAEEGGSTPCCLHVDVCMYVCICLPDAKTAVASPALLPGTDVFQL